LGTRTKYHLRECGGIICSSPRYIASILWDTGISLYDRTKNYEKLTWNLNDFKNIFQVRAIFLENDRLATIGNPSNILKVTSISDHGDHILHRVPILGVKAIINDLHQIPQNPKKLLINCYEPCIAVVFDMEQHKSTKIEHSGYSISRILPDNTGNGAWYLGTSNKQNILGHWDFRTSKPAASIKTDCFKGTSLAVSPDNKTCAMMCINQDYDKELRIFDLVSHQNRVTKPVSKTADLSPLSFIGDNTVLYSGTEADPLYSNNGKLKGLHNVHPAIHLESVSTELTNICCYPDLQSVDYHQNSNLFITYPLSGIADVYEPINQ
jgi:hypothetical protein